MTACYHCNSTNVAWGKKKDGSPMLMEASTPHFVVCPAQKSGKPKPKVRGTGKPGAKGSVPGRSRDSRNGVDPETRAMVVKNWGKTQDEELLPYAKGETLEDQFLSVLHYINNKGGA